MRFLNDLWKLKEVKLLTALLLFLILSYFGFQLYKKIKKPKYEPKNLDAAEVDEKLSQAEILEAKKLADSLYDDMKGITVLNRDIQSFKDMATATNVYFKQVYDSFGLRDSYNLSEWLKGESPAFSSYIWGGFWNNQDEFNGYKNTIIERAKNLAL